jgi:RNA polymerase sigma factor for flagellar operon FliA
VVQEGWVGILQAAERYDPDRDVRFGSFAKMRVRGAMLDYLRSLDRIPKHIRAAGEKLLSARRNVEQRLGRHASEDEVADEAGVTIDEYCQLERVLLGQSVVEFNEQSDYFGHTDHGWTEDLHEALRDAIDNLPGREATVIRLMYYENKSIYETGDVLGISGSRVSQIHARVILKLKWALRKYAPSVPRTSVHASTRLYE